MKSDERTLVDGFWWTKEAERMKLDVKPNSDKHQTEQQQPFNGTTMDVGWNGNRCLTKW
jgi:hypothetical protein